MIEIAPLITFIIFAVTFAPIFQWLLKRKQYCDVLDKIPGPKSYPFVGTMWEFIGAPRNDFFYVTDRRSRKYPGIHRIWVGFKAEVRVMKAEYVEKLLCSSKHTDKSPIYRFMIPWLGEGLLTAKSDRWHKHRKIITPTFHFNILDSFCDVFAEKSEILNKRLEKHCGTGEPVEVFEYITKAALDIICETAMGTKIEAQTDVENEYVNAVYELCELMMLRSFKVWLQYDFIFNKTKLGRRYNKALGILHGFTNEVIKERRLSRKRNNEEKEMENEIGLKKRLAFLDLLLEGNEKNNLLSIEDIRMEVDTFMFEGHDTTSAGIAWTLFLIGLDDKIQQKVYDEVDSIFHGTERGATIKDLQEMKYLERCIKEALRMHPSVSFISRTTSEEVEFGEYKLPTGTTVGVHIYHLHRDERYFPDPEKYDPDRFLPENIEKRHPYAYIPFSAGPRNCIGQKFALYEEKSVISSILRKFKIKSADSQEDVKILHELISRPLGGIRLFLEKRN